MKLSYTKGTVTEAGEERGALILAMSREEHADHFSSSDRIALAHVRTDANGDVHFEAKPATNGRGAKASEKNIKEGGWASEDFAVSVQIVNPKFCGQRPPYFGRSSELEIACAPKGVVRLMVRRANMTLPRNVCKKRSKTIVEMAPAASIVEALKVLANHQDLVPVEPANAALFVRLLNRQVAEAGHLVRTMDNRVQFSPARWTE